MGRSADDVAMQEGTEGARRGWRGRLERGLAVYERHERFAAPLFFFGGVVWDALTLQRIDAWFDNTLLIGYLVVVGLLILVATLVEYECTTDARWCRYREWYPPAIQFFLGALFSANVIFYFQSASLSQSLVFVVVLVGLLVANEFIHQRLFDLYVLVALYFLASFSFFTFFVPVVTKEMSYRMFLVGGLLSLGLVGAMIVFFALRNVFARPRQFVYAVGMILALFGLLNLFYLENWIPPVPLAMRYGGIFHAVQRVEDAYALQFEPPAWYEFWEDADEVFHRAPGEPVYAFAAVFAPTRLETQVFHEWSVYDEEQRAWVTTDRIGYEVVGGRNRGYRGYTLKRNVWPGRWRVNVQTASGRTLGRIRFRIEAVDAQPENLARVRYE